MQTLKHGPDSAKSLNVLVSFLDSYIFKGNKMYTSIPGLAISNQNFSVVLSHNVPARVIVSVPHDGLPACDFSNTFQQRKIGNMGGDLHVWPIVNDVVYESFIRGLKIDAVRLLMARTYIDGNRALSHGQNLDPDTPRSTALDDKNLLPAYNYYHAAIQKLVKRSIAKYGASNVLLIDMHGFGKQPPAFAREHDIILGTANRATIPHSSIDMDFAIFMEQNGYTVFLPGIMPIVSGGDPLNAGHTTRFYASRYGINALQIEIYSIFRKREERERGVKLAQDVSKFLALHYI